ncbi:TatD family hydrolase [Lacisediminimonas profundi]|uniref:TatD family hydrolase n=1 Tax=Lacisediminimonas profundi TaxID=2603856 RepID=UPI00124B834E|nr:TatD family hydrolase [Lacisediminimonas profundi]
MWVDTHCHLDAAEFGGESLAVARRAELGGVTRIVIPAVNPGNFATVAQMSSQLSTCRYALGIHPIFVPDAVPEDLDLLRQTVRASLSDPRLVAIGEIGLDFFMPALVEPAMREKQEYFYGEQLKLARDVGLPVLLHVRCSQDIVLKFLRRIEVCGGIAHAFNGSFQQARSYLDLGMKLGFGGAMTFTRALQIRRLAAQLPLSAIVLETDAPDMSPSWLHPAPNSPEELPRIGAALAELRGMAVPEVALQTTANAHAVLVRLSTGE